MIYRRRPRMRPQIRVADALAQAGDNLSPVPFPTRVSYAEWKRESNQQTNTLTRTIRH